MKEAEAKLLIATGVIESATLMRQDDGAWECWLYGEELPSSTKNPVELARGGRRTWSSLDTLYSWLTDACGRRVIAVSIDRVAGW